MLKRRREILDMYEAALADLPVEILSHDGRDSLGREYHSSRHLCLARLEGKTEAFRNALIEALAEEGVAANVHYKPLPMHTAYKKLGFDIKDYPNAFHQYENEITLPLHTCLSDEQVKWVTEAFRRRYAGLQAAGRRLE